MRANCQLDAFFSQNLPDLSFSILEADEQVRQMWRGAFVVVTLSSMVLAFQEHQPAVQTLGSSGNIALTPVLRELLFIWVK